MIQLTRLEHFIQPQMVFLVSQKHLRTITNIGLILLHYQF